MHIIQWSPDWQGRQRSMQLSTLCIVNPVMAVIDIVRRIESEGGEEHKKEPRI